MELKILVAAHKKYPMPQDEIYFPLHVGKKGKESIGYTGDDTGDHISDKNPNFCELTGLYWAWKNLDAETIGLAHYRRHFTVEPRLSRLIHGKSQSVLTKAQAEKLLKQALAINPGGIDPNYFYGDFLSRQKRYAEARTALEKALAASDRPGRESADAGRRAEARRLLEQVVAKLAQGAQ